MSTAASDDETRELAGDGVLVCIRTDGSDEEVRHTLESVLRTTPPDVSVALCGPDSLLAALPDPDSRPLRRFSGEAAVRDAAGSAASDDVVVLDAGCSLPTGWLASMAATAYAQANVATVNAVPLHVVDDSSAPADLNEAVALFARNPSPGVRLSMADGPCTYVRRSAFQLVGPLDGRSALSEFSARCTRRGLVHLLAGNLVVSDPNREHQCRLAQSGGARTISAARRVVRGLTVAIDARALAGPREGTRTHVLELVSALAGSSRLRLAVIVSDGLNDELRSFLAALPDVSLRGPEEWSSAGFQRPDIVHRPHQVSTPADLGLLAGLGERLIVTHQDLIGFHSGGYFASPSDWHRYRELTRRSLAAVDAAVFPSQHVCMDALAEQLIEPERASVIPLGVDHVHVTNAAQARAPVEFRLPADSELMLCLGNDYQHKNRLFALSLADQLQRRHAWQGRLVLAGPQVRYGSSRAEEDAMLDASPPLAGAVVRLGEITDAEKSWLLKRASVVLYPTLQEGFGLIPFEAASHGTPCVWAAGTSLSDVLPESAAQIVPWDAAATSDRVLELLRDAGTREKNVASITEAAGRLRWETTAAQLIELYYTTAERAPAPGGVLERTSGLMRQGLSEDALRLVGPGGMLPRDAERPLLALAAHRRVAAPVLGAIKAGYWVSQRWPRRIPRTGRE